MEIENIKFKAKRLDNEEWVKGDLVHSTSYVGISYPSDEFSNVSIVHRVDPKTVCQFTGLKDENGVELYEGDLVQVTGQTRIIEYNKKYCAFVMKEEGEYLMRELDFLTKYAFNIIGNKFDKKE